MNLKTDESRFRQRILDRSARSAVESGFEGIADGLDANFIPISLIENFASLLAELQGISTERAWIEPTAAGFIVDAATCPAVFLRVAVDFDLVTMHPVDRDGDFFTLPDKIGW